MSHWTEDEAWAPGGRLTGFLAASTQPCSLLAWSLLENSHNLPPRLVDSRGLRFGLPRLLIWEGGAEPFTLTVFQPFPSKEQPIVRKAIWQSRSDFRQMCKLVEENDSPVNYEPSITVSDALVPAAEFETMMLSGQELRLPFVELTYPDSVNSDAGTRGIEFHTLNQPQSKVSLEWCCLDDSPSQWRPAIHFALQLWKFLEKCLQKPVKAT